MRTSLAPIRSTASSRSPTRTTRPPHSAIVSSAPAGSSPSRTGITANMVRATLRDAAVAISARARRPPSLASRFDARLARVWRTTSIEHGQRDRGGERQQEGLGVVVFERLAADEAEQRGVRRPDHRGDRDPGREPRPWLTGDARRDGERGPPAGDEAGGDEQQAATLADLGVRPVEAGLALGLALPPSARWRRSTGGRAGRPCCHRGRRRPHRRR